VGEWGSVEPDPGTQPEQNAGTQPGAQNSGFLPGLGQGAQSGGMQVGGVDTVGGSRRSNRELVEANQSELDALGQAEDVPASLRAYVRRYLRTLRGQGATEPTRED
jgi:hypothetical protein